MAFSDYFSSKEAANTPTAQNLQRFLNDNPYGASIGNGYRSADTQAQIMTGKIKQTLGPEAANRWQADVQSMGAEAASVQWEPQLRSAGILKWVAMPGRSNHQTDGGAFDLTYKSDEARKWAHDNAASYGYHFPMAHEPWHIEPIKSGDTTVNLAQTKTSPPSQGETGSKKEDSAPTINPITGDAMYASASPGGGSSKSAPASQAQYSFFGDPMPSNQYELVYGTNTYGTNPYGQNLSLNTPPSASGLASLILGGFS